MDGTGGQGRRVDTQWTSENRIPAPLFLHLLKWEMTNYLYVGGLLGRLNEVRFVKSFICLINAYKIDSQQALVLLLSFYR